MIRTDLQPNREFPPFSCTVITDRTLNDIIEAHNTRNIFGIDEDELKMKQFYRLIPKFHRSRIECYDKAFAQILKGKSEVHHSLPTKIFYL